MKGVNIRNELLSLTYGSIVRQAIEDNEGDIETANKQIETIGFNMGQRMIDEFLAKSECEPCKNFKEVAEKVCLGFKMFLGVDCKMNVKNEQEYSYIFAENPLDENVTLSDDHENLDYSNIICGMIRGALSAVNLRVKCYFVNDRLQKEKKGQGNSSSPYEIKLELEEIVKKKLINYDD
jgi:hypothetical protein